MFGSLVKAVVDIEREKIAVDGSLHIDLEQLLVEDGSVNENLWGINIYPEKNKKERIEFDSIINLKPAFSNRTRGIENEEIREKVRKIAESYIIK